MSAVVELEQAFLPLLRDAEHSVAAEYPKFRFNVGASSVGGQTEYQGHIVWLECLFPDAAENEADLVSILVGAKHVTTEPKLCEASVAWGNGQHPQVSVELLEQPLQLTELSLQQTAARFPELLAVYRRALQAWVARSLPNECSNTGIQS